MQKKKNYEKCLECNLVGSVKWKQILYAVSKGIVALPYNAVIFYHTLSTLYRCSYVVYIMHKCTMSAVDMSLRHINYLLYSKLRKESRCFVKATILLYNMVISFI